MALPQQVRGAYILIDRGKTSTQILQTLEGWGLYYPRIGRGWGRGGALQRSAKLRCSAASRTVHSG